LFFQEDPFQWDNNHVCQWAKEKAGLTEKDIAILQKSKLKGPNLLKMTTIELINQGIKGLSSDALYKIPDAVKKLKDETGNTIVFIPNFKKIKKNFVSLNYFTSYSSFCFVSLFLKNFFIINK
jgi:hypothetical protein